MKYFPFFDELSDLEAGELKDNYEAMQQEIIRLHEAMEQAIGMYSLIVPSNPSTATAVRILREALYYPEIPPTQ
jgi:hypothetical protein